MSPRAVALYELLLPYAERIVVVGSATDCYGSAARYLGLLATTMERWEEAPRHFEDALVINAKIGARPFVARTQYEYACMLLTRGRPGDRKRALELLDQALATARELEMKKLEEKIQGLRASTPHPTPSPQPLTSSVRRVTTGSSPMKTQPSA